MAAKKKTSFYHTRWNKVGINEKIASEVLGVSVDQVQEWDRNGAPEIAERLLLLWDKKRVNVPGWEGWIFSRGTLRYKGKQWRPDNILAARYDVERTARLEGQLKKLHSWPGLIKIAHHLLKTSVARSFI